MNEVEATKMYLLDYVCDYCSRSFTRKYNLQNHIENCHIKASCYCDTCEQTFSSPAGLQLHLSRGHNSYSQSFPECDLCGRVFTRKQNITSHMITVHLQDSAPVIRCSLCYKTFISVKNLKRHVNQLHNPNKRYAMLDSSKKSFESKKSFAQCHLCKRVYTNNRNLRRHIETTHGEKGEFKCEICPKVYTSNQSLRRHLRTRHNFEDQEPLKCEFCDKLITGKENLDSHIHFFHNVHENTGTNYASDCSPKTNEFVCRRCNQGFEEEPLLRQHIKTHHSFKTFYKYCKSSLSNQIPESSKQMPYFCEYCTHSFMIVYELKAHMKVVHDVEYSLSSCNVCFSKFYSKDTILKHKERCLPPDNVNSCNYCDKLFTDISSLEFHMRIFHPQSQIADSNITSTNTEDIEGGSFKCDHCDRIYYSDRSLKHHIKLKHTTDEAMECGYCGKICSNKYYLASHIKMVHNEFSWSKCDYCDKQFKSKRNIRRHIEYTHLGMQRYKCIECETLFKEKRSLRKHVRTKHPDSATFPACHFCNKRFESAKSCKIHLKLLHSFNMNTHPCDLCPVSFSSDEALRIHLRTNHLAKDEIYKCEACNMVFKGQDTFDQHNELCHVNVLRNANQKVLPRCVLCVKDFSTRKTLKRHIKKFHNMFDMEELANYAFRNICTVYCEECVKHFNDELYFNIYLKSKHLRDSVVFKCKSCMSSYNTFEYSVQRYRLTNLDMIKSKLMLSELCTTEMSDEETAFTGFSSPQDAIERESTTSDTTRETQHLEIKIEPGTP